LLSFSAPAHSDTAITLAWDRNTEPEIVGYKVYFGTAHRYYFWPPIDVGNVTQHTITGLNEGQPYYFSVVAYDSSGYESYFSNEVHYPLFFNDPRPLNVRIGFYRDGYWFLDNNNNGIWEGCDQDICEKDGFNPWDTRVVGDWDGEGKKNMGIYINGQWILERNGNAVWDDFDYYYREFLKENYSIDYPIVGDWNGDGRDKVGIFRNGYWYLDKNGNGNWDGCDVDICLGPFAGEPEDIPIIGDWTGNGKSKIGTYRNGYWYLDYNENGNWDGCEVDLCLGPFGGSPGDIPVVGDWAGYGRSEIGIYRNGVWALDFIGNGVWDGCGADKCIEAFEGNPGDIPVIR